MCTILDHLKQQLKDIDDQLLKLNITVKDPSGSPHSDREPVGTLVIPNKLFLLWDRKTALQRKLSASVSKHYELAQSRLQGREIILEKSALVEKRFKKESSRFLKFYRSKKIGTTQRNNMLACDTNMTIFKDEVSSTRAVLQYSGKDYSELSSRHQRRRREQIRDDVETHLSNPLFSIGLTVDSVQLKDINSNESFSVRIGDIETESTTNNEGNDHIPEICYLLLNYGVSTKFYHELAMECKKLPRLHQVKQFKQDLHIPPILPTPGSFQGAQFNFNEILMKLTKEEVEAHASYYQTKKSILIKISGDGAKYSRGSTFCLLSFSFIRTSVTDQENQGSGLSSSDVHTIAIIRAAENYENIKEGFGDAISAVNNYIKNPIINICDNEYELKFAMCSDYKFLLTTMGMKQANSTYSCLWCEVKDEERHDMDLSSNKRTLSSIRTNATKGKYGCIKAPLFDIELEYIVPDELHLFLRIMDVLIQALIDTAVAHDHHTSRGARRGPKIPPQDGPMVKNLIKTIQSCGVNFYVWEEKKEGNGLLWPSLMGNDKTKLLKGFPSKISNLCQPPQMVDKLKELWNDFDGIYSTISSRNPTSYHDLHERGKEWISLFLELAKEPVSDGYQPNRVTPYMHIMVHHVPSAIDFHSNIKQFSCQAVEKNNDDAKKIYFRSSNKWDAAYDILANEHRIHQLQWCKRKARDYDKSKNEEYWKQGGIQESRKKRQRISSQSTIS